MMNRRVILVIFLLGILIAGFSAQADENGPPPRPGAGCGVDPMAAPGETVTRGVWVDGLERTYRLHFPYNYNRETPSPLVLFFHGYSSTAAITEQHTQMSQHADQNGYLVVYPQATAFYTDAGDPVTSWNDLACSQSRGSAGLFCQPGAADFPFPPTCGSPTPCTWCTCADDLAFVNALLETLDYTLCIDWNRVYAAGHSNGGMFAYRLGCEMADRLAAIASVSGTPVKGFGCTSGMTLSVLHIHGTEDDVVPPDGSLSRNGYLYTPADAYVARWGSAQQCDSEPTRYYTRRDGASELECVQYDGCATGAEVVACSWEGEHPWPYFANTILWDFFKQNPRW